jgi:hypothetical protein
MSTLRIVTLECVKKQDLGLGKDEVVIKVDGLALAGPFTMGRNDKVTVNATRSFSGFAKVNLTELDGGLNFKDDDLGTVTVKDNVAGLGDQTSEFHALAGADYHMTYRVD